MTFQIKHYLLPHDGLMPGARGYKKVIVPKGTRVYCIVYGTLIYWCTYLYESEAHKCMLGLEDTAKRLGLKTVVDWNFKTSIPKRVYRSQEYRI